MIDMREVNEKYGKYQKTIENIIIPLILLAYPLLKINQGIDVSDTTYSLGNFQYFGSMEGTWMVATFLSNAVGSLLLHLPFGDTLIGMYFYTALFQSVTAIAAYTALRRRLPAAVVFLGEFMALGLCWCPSVILYNYLTYLLMTAGVLLLYRGILAGGNAAFFYIAAGVCLGANAAVRMPNVVQAAFIVAVWYGAALACHDKNRILSAKGRLEASEESKRNRQHAWQKLVKDTLWCILGYGIGFGVPLCAICIKYGVNAYPAMVKTMFAMTQKATDYKPSSMVTGMFGDYITGLYWLFFAGICMAGGFLLVKVQQRFGGGNRAVCLLCRFVYAAVLLVLLRFYWGKGMFSFRYYEYTSMYYPAVLLLLAAIAAAVYCLVCKGVCAEQKILAMLVLVQIFVTPLGSNNALYPIINNLFLVIPFTLWVVWGWLQMGSNQQGRGFVWKAPLVILVIFVLVQSIGFHQNFVFQDGVYGEKRTVCITAPAKAANVYTGQDNGEMLQELAEYVQTNGLVGRKIISYGELPGLGYLLDMPPALSTFWPDLDSYRMVEYERDMAQLESEMRQEGSDDAPVIILASYAAAYLSEDADAMNWFGTDREALDADEKLQMLDAFMREHGYQEQFCNARYAVYTVSLQ